MKVNKTMKAILGRKSIDDFIFDVKLDNKLLDILDKGAIEFGEAVIWSVERRNARNTPVSSFPDLTGYECFLNHIHIDDYVSQKKQDKHESLRQGICFGIKTKMMLINQFPEKKINIIITFSKDGCVTRFHVIRAQESWLPANLNVFQDEAILVLTT